MMSRNRIMAGVPRARKYLPSFNLRARSTSASTSIPGAPKIISRRAWEAQRMANPRKPFLREKEPDVAWPEKVRYTFYVVSAALIPYFGVWFLCSRRDTRDWLLPQLSENSQEKLRRHFGEPDLDALGYCEVVERGEDAVPSRFPDDWSDHDRRMEAAVQELNSDQALPLKLYTIENDGGTITEDNAVQELPAATLVSNLTPPSTTDAILAVQFPNAETRESQNDQLQSDYELIDAEPLSQTTEPLLRTAHTYSPWYYQAGATASADAEGTHSNSSASNMISQDEAARSRLEYEIQAYEAELRGASVRPVDDIMADLSRAKTELRSLRWKRFMPWRKS